ncbi:MAG: class I SAM-dependent methyltransferase [Candidatus Eisenbacteria bacterium]
MSIHKEIHGGLMKASEKRLEHTRRAYRMLRAPQEPRILDVGCGSGDVTIELAKISGGRATGLDIDASALEELARNAREAGLAGRIETVNRSMLEIDFPDETFDIVWAEGAIHIIGFERGLDEMRRLIKPDGSLVLHEMLWLRPNPPPEIRSRWHGVYPGIRTAPEYVAEIPRHGYEPVGHFTLPEEFWWEEYYGPLTERVRALRGKHAGDRAALAVLDREEREAELYRRNARWYGSGFFVMRRVP